MVNIELMIDIWTVYSADMLVGLSGLMDIALNLLHADVHGVFDVLNPLIISD